MRYYRKKPVVIDAWRNGYDEPMPDWLAEALMAGKVRHERPSFFIPTLEGTMRADYGDWIVRGVKGEIYPVKDDIFVMMYAPETDPNLIYPGKDKDFTFPEEEE